MMNYLFRNTTVINSKMSYRRKHKGLIIYQPNWWLFAVFRTHIIEIQEIMVSFRGWHRFQGASNRQREEGGETGDGGGCDTKICA